MAHADEHVSYKCHTSGVYTPCPTDMLVWVPPLQELAIEVPHHPNGTFSVTEMVPPGPKAARMSIAPFLWELDGAGGGREAC